MNMMSPMFRLPTCDWENIWWPHNARPDQVSHTSVSEAPTWTCCGKMVLACAHCMQWVCAKSVVQPPEVGEFPRKSCQRPAMHCQCHRTPFDVDPSKSRKLKSCFRVGHPTSVLALNVKTEQWECQSRPRTVDAEVQSRIADEPPTPSHSESEGVLHRLISFILNVNTVSS